MKISNLYWSLNWFFTIYIPKVFDYAKILLHDYDFEFEYLLPLIELKTKRTREYLVKENVVHVDEKRMKEVELLCHRIFKDEYLPEERANLYSRYPVRSVAASFFNHSKHPLEDMYYNELRIICEKCEQIKKQDKERLFYLLRKNINCWWS